MRNKLLSLLTAGLLLGSLSTSHAFSTSGGKILDGQGNAVSINGIAWIGFQDSNFFDGLSSTPFNPIGTQNGVIQLVNAPWNVTGSGVTTANGVAFKSVRIPIQPGMWHSTTTIPNPPFSFTATSSTSPLTGNGPFCDWTSKPDSSGHCTKSLTAPNLLTAAINQFNTQNMYVMLDFHHRPGLGDNFRDGTVVASNYTLQNYHDDVASFVKAAPTNVIGVDLYNEPYQLYWFQSNTSTSPAQPAWINVIAAAASAIYDNNQSVLLFVEGPGGQTPKNDPADPVTSNSVAICLPSSTKVDDTTVISLQKNTTLCKNAAFPEQVTNINSNWGENFRALIDTTQSANGVAKFNVTNFRAQLISAITANNFSNTDPNLIANWLLGANNDGNGGHIVFAPHLYGSAVAGWQSDANDSKIRFDWNFGFLTNSGFPFVVGELGYDVQLPQSGGEDFFIDSVAPYLVSKNSPNNLFFWTLTNSDSPVGLRTNDSGWGLFAWKEQDLHNLFGTTPPPPQAVGTLCAEVPTPSGYTGTSFPVITATGTSNYTINLTSFGTLTCVNNVATGSYSITGSTITGTNGVSYKPQQPASATVTQNATTNVTLPYVAQSTPMGSLQVNVTGGTGCAISATQPFVVTYASGSSSNTLQVTGTTPASASVAPGTYTISVSPAVLPSNPQCNAQFTASVNVTANTTTQENINFVATTPPPPSSFCTVNATCQIWGTPSDSWSGSSCDFVVTTKTPMSKPTVLSMTAAGIKSLTEVWNAKGTLKSGTLTLTLTDPVNTHDAGFTASGVITLPTQANLSTNGNSYTCPVIAQ